MNNPHPASIELPSLGSMHDVQAQPATALAQASDAKKTAMTFDEAVKNSVTGQVYADTLDVSMVIGTEDVIEGKIKTGKGKSIVVRGTVIGAIECQGRVVILHGAKVLGSIKATALWVEGDVGEHKNPAMIDVCDLHLGVNSRVTGDCIYDSMGMALPNRGVNGRLIPRAEVEADNG